MKVGIPKERANGEARVPTTPEIAKKLVAGGLTVLLERGAGAAAYYTDAAYEQVGVQLTDAAGALACDIVAKVRRPLEDEVAAMREGSVFIGHAETCEQDAVTSAMHQRKITLIAMERIPRISRAQSMDALSSQSNIAGYRAVLSGEPLRALHPFDDDLGGLGQTCTCGRAWSRCCRTSGDSHCASPGR